MKRYSDLMKNGVLYCDVKECGYNYNGRCLYFASPNSDDKENDICKGKLPRREESLQVKMFRTNFSNISTERLEEYKEMLEELSYCIDMDSTAVKLSDIWKVLSCFRQNVSSEITKRENAKHQKARERDVKRKKGLPVATTKRNIVRPLKSKKLGKK